MNKLSAFFCVSFISCVIFAAWPVFAGDLTISASVDRNVVSLDGQIMLEVNISGSAANIPHPQLPDLANFTVYSAGSSQNMSFVNGSFSSSLSFKYALTPKSTGKFTIPSIALQYDNRTYQTQPISVEVTPSGTAPAPGQSAPQPAPSSGGQAPQGSDRKDLFVTASIDKASAYVNEQITYTFRFYRRIKLLANPQYIAPNFTGFWTEDMPPKNYYSTIDGQQYLVSEVKTILFPTKPGTYNLGNAALKCSVEDFNPNDFFSDDFFGNFFSGGRTQVLNTVPVSINVVPLPDSGKPGNFSGAVGEYEISAAADKTSVKTNEPVTLTVTVSGKGNIKTISDPGLANLNEFRKYEPVSSTNIEKETGILKGSKIFKTIIVPQTPGRKTIQPVSFVFFDDRQKRYVTKTTSPIYLEVKPGAAFAGPANQASPSNEIKMMNQDINYIKDLAKWETSGGYIYNRPWFAALNSLPVLAFGFSFLYLRRRERLSTDIAYARKLRASPSARKYLRDAKILLKSHSPDEFYCAVSKALLEFVANKANVSKDGLTFNSLAGLLAGRNIGNDSIAKAKEILDECGLVRFAPTHATKEMMSQTFEKAQELIGILEKELK